MFTLFDILQAQGGNGVQGLSQQFGLSPEQSRRAMEALLPAFTLGLQRNAVTDPTGFAQLFGMVGPNAARPGLASPQADFLVQQLFGSPHLSQAVIQQAAAASGVATPVLKQMLPVLAGMVVAGIVHVMINQSPPPPQAPSPSPALYGFPPAAYWTEMVDAFLAAGGAPKQSEVAGRSRSQSLAKPPTRPGPSRGAEPAGGKEGAPFELFQQLVQSGLDAQQENAKAMQRLFDAFWTEPSSQRNGDSAR
ncbi:DUF937 domain-containing protein [Methylobacterium iners]|uniref:DUF937 domain-containing protein n=1 Tax=Methylobacterium iners TaxID=418707 RepID=A0ABQ4S2I8_9HYPH|nr:DUF937 domain-containing protein [Methylobacterium iners]GJD96033.1 hypothetical protein OCOJLMKI_3251 [Methylobacterium iners]